MAIENNLFFIAYKNFVDYLLLNGDDRKYKIIITKGNADRKVKVNVSIIVDDSPVIEERGQVIFSNNIILPPIEVESLMESIVEDFEYNHIITYASVDKTGKIQKLQNTKFLLCIHLNNERELDNALERNDTINTNPNRFTKIRRYK